MIKVKERRTRMKRNLKMRRKVEKSRRVRNQRRLKMSQQIRRYVYIISLTLLYRLYGMSLLS